MFTETITIEGMRCAGACVLNVKEALREIEGLTINEVGLGFANISYEKVADLPARTRKAIIDAGFRPTS